MPRQLQDFGSVRTKMLATIILALSSNVLAQMYVAGPEYGAGHCGQQPCGQPYPGIGALGMPIRQPPCVSQYPMQCVPVPQQYGAISCVCSTSSGVYQGAEYPYHPPQPQPWTGGVVYRPPPSPPPPPPRPIRRPRCRVECRDDGYYYRPVDMEMEWSEYGDDYQGYGHCRRVCYPYHDDRGRYSSWSC